MVEEGNVMAEGRKEREQESIMTEGRGTGAETATGNQHMMEGRGTSWWKGTWLEQGGYVEWNVVEGNVTNVTAEGGMGEERQKENMVTWKEIWKGNMVRRKEMWKGGGGECHKCHGRREEAGTEGERIMT